ncbi:glycoside hydrolase family 70 protein [Leuconostoc citreum]|uniref:glycoside hydrolase family 70 protein n=3 Tax=Leuconostoc citreum TaxID=33964 RepID=UPI0029583A00|nr:glycoside hydrolase family 70 protein [Leuconostoc citreum]MDV8931380.1 GW dipeptide domain-containing protein [Leuconostoc citreum]
MRQKETITRKKLYKSGKSWVAVATAFAVMGVSAVTTVSADTQTPVGTTQSQQDLTGQTGQDKPTTKEVIDKKEPVPQVSAQNAGDLSADAKTTKADDKQDTQPTNAQLPDQGNKQTNSNSDKGVKESTTAPVKTTDVPSKSVAPETNTSINGGQYVEKDGQFVYIDQSGKQVSGLQNIEGHTQYFDPKTGYQTKGELKNIDDNAYYFDKNSGNGRTFTKISNGSYSEKDGMWQYVDSHDKQPVKGLYDVEGNLQYFDLSTGNQAKHQIRSVDGVTYYFDADSGNATAFKAVTNGRYAEQTTKDKDGNETSYWAYVDNQGHTIKGLNDVNGEIQYFDEHTGEQLKGHTATVGGTTYYFEGNKGNLVSVVNTAPTGQYKINGDNVYYLDNNNEAIKGLYGINGNLNYFDLATGIQLKGQAKNIDGIGYYFDKDTGNGSYQYTLMAPSNKNDYTQHNVVNNLSESNFKNLVDGFLTAETWYRPAQILSHGTDWVASTDKDFRPLITVWWPNKDIQVNYLRLMQNEGVLNQSAVYDLNTDQLLLNEAAQQAQIGIEKKISQTGNTDWLNHILFTAHDGQPSFIKQQYLWNSDSEYHTGPFQGGYLKYQNSDLTPNVNSKYRNADNSLDFLLANDVDNSNPIVQAEDLNWLYYLLNFGSITTQGKENNSNFDSIRIDAVDFVSNDLIQRTYDYLRAAYGVDKNDKEANAHLSLVEAGLDAGTTTIHQDALIESDIREAMKKSLTNGPGSNISLSNLIQDKEGDKLIADRANNSTENVAIPNYSIIHAHDKDIQDKVGAAITDATGADWTNFTPEQLQKGLSLYYEDQRKIEKKYNQYNIPSAYALLLTNKDTVPRVYYGDMYQDDGQYMQKQSLYFDTITALMEARKQFVAGGQTINVDDNGVLTSVRFGKGAMTANDIGTNETRTQGIGVVIANDPSLKLSKDSKVTLHMGAAHRNQNYRALLLTTDNGIDSYSSSKNAPVIKTDDNGDLVFSNQDINGQRNTKVHGFLNSEVSGYLSAWVPLDATEQQDARTLPSEKSVNDGKVLHSNAALDSNLIYEAFSNFQPMPTNRNEYTNVVIADKADTFKSWGITSFEMAPQYRSSQDKTFLDSTIDNGYAFTDRYDLGFEKPTKYGNDEDLRQAIKQLHSSGMQVMADVVANQIYNLPGKEVASTNRVDWNGNNLSTPFGTQMYVVNTVGGGKYQNKYGGEFLDKLKAAYPDIFRSKNYEYDVKNYGGNGTGSVYYTVDSKTRAELDTDTKIKEWSAKYMNGTNVLGLGMGYVLKDWQTGQYFNVSNQNMKFLLPSDLISNDIAVQLGVPVTDKKIIFDPASAYNMYSNLPEDMQVMDYQDDKKSTPSIKPLSSYNNKQVQVTRQYTDSKGVSWNLITFAGGDLQGQKLWVDSRALTMTPFKTMNQISFISYANRNDGLFLNAPYPVKGYQLAGMSNQYKGQQVTIAGVANVSGKDWSLISFNGTQYWIDSQALNTNFTHDMNQKVFVNTTSNLDGLFLNAPYRQPGYKLAGLAKNYNNQTVTVSQQYFDDQGTVWSQVVLGGQTVWVDNHALAQMQVSDTSQQLYVNSNGRNDGLFLNAPYRGQGSQLIGMTADYNGQHVQVTKQGQDAYGAQWRLITLNNQQVWVDSRALSTTIMQAMNDDMYVNSSQRTDGLWLNAPYTMSGAKWAGDTRSANGRYVHISKAYSNEVGNTYYLTNLNGQSTWIDKRAFTATFDQVVALNATIVARQRPDGMFKTAPYGEAGAQFVDYVTNYNQQTVPVTKQHSDAQGNQWYLATVNGTQYWIDQRSFSPVVTKVVDYQAKIVPRTTRDGVFSGAPYGEVNAKLVNMATAYQNQVVHATGEYTNASGITWSQFALSGQEDKLWIDKRALQA